MKHFQTDVYTKVFHYFDESNTAVKYIGFLAGRRVCLEREKREKGEIFTTQKT